MFLITLLACQTASDSDLESVNQHLAAELNTANTKITDLSARLAALEAKVAAHTERLDAQATSFSGIETDVGALEADLTATKDELDARLSELESIDNDHEFRLATTEGGLDDVVTWQTGVSPLFDYVSVDKGTDSVVFEGANVFVQSGSGKTDGTINGLGNLIIGYHEAGSWWTLRTGSHNIVVGMENYYSSYGGIIAGESNFSAAPSSSVLGGYFSATSGDYSVIVGGTDQVASGDYSAVVGGTGNDATGDYSAVLGGSSTTASGYASTVVGGLLNTASGDVSSVLGGSGNTASGAASTVYGGSSQKATTDYSYKP